MINFGWLNCLTINQTELVIEAKVIKQKQYKLDPKLRKFLSVNKW